MCYQNFVLEYYNALVSAPCSRTEQFLKAQGKWYDEVNKLISVSYYVVAKIQVNGGLIRIHSMCCWKRRMASTE